MSRKQPKNPTLVVVDPCSVGAVNDVHVEVEGHTLKLSNLDKVLYPRTGTTKGEVLNYYAQIAPVLLPHIGDRATTRIRWPHGVQGNSFFEKNVPAGTPSWLRTVRVPTTGSRARSGSGDELVFPLIDNLAALTYVVNLASLELHVHQWTVDAEGQTRPPNRLVIDLDPGEPAGLGECCQVALAVRDKLADRGMEASPVTSGSKGLHLYAALPGDGDQVSGLDSAPDSAPGSALDSEGATALAKEIAEELQAEYPALVTATMTKARRRGKVFLDWSQNAGSKTTIAPYSLRGRERPTVAAPRAWAEIEDGADDPLAIEHCGFEQVLDRVAEDGDLFLAP